MTTMEAAARLANGALRTTKATFGAGTTATKTGISATITLAKAANDHLIQKPANYAAARWPAQANFAFKSASAVKKLLSASVSITDPGYSIKLTASAVKDLYSAVFESAALALGMRKSRGGPALASATALGVAAAAALLSTQAEFRDTERVYADECPPVAELIEKGYKYSTAPAPDKYFDTERVLDHTSIVGLKASFNLFMDRIPYNPDVIEKYRTSERVRGYVDLAVQEAEKNGIDPALYVNLLHQESHFRADIVNGTTVSGMGAVGIAQFIPEVAQRLYGLSVSDLKDWKKAIPAGAKHLASLAEKHNHDPVLMLAEYNAGNGSIQDVREELGRDNISGREWLAVNKERHAKRVQCGYIAGLWDTETYPYAARITGISLSPEFAELAMFSYDDFKELRAVENDNAPAAAPATTALASSIIPLPRPDNFDEIVQQTRNEQQRARMDALVGQVLAQN